MPTFFMNVSANYLNDAGVIVNFHKTYSRNINQHDHAAINQFVHDAMNHALGIIRQQSPAFTKNDLITTAPTVHGNVGNSFPI
jgi:hypothetical protein